MTGADTSTEVRAADLALLGLLQLADTSFPSGAYTLSHGLETMVADGLVSTADHVGEVLAVSLLSRFARGDLPALLWAHDAAGRARAGDIGAIEDLLAIDRRLRAVKLAREEREGSERVGRRIVIEAAALAPSTCLTAYDAAIRRGDGPGNSAVALGVAAEAFGIGRRQAALVAGMSHATAFAMAALRLGVTGHREAQRVIRRSIPMIERAVDVAASVAWLDLRPSAPQLDVSSGRHEIAAARSFAS